MWGSQKGSWSVAARDPTPGATLLFPAMPHATRDIEVVYRLLVKHYNSNGIRGVTVSLASVRLVASSRPSESVLGAGRDPVRSTR